MMYTYSTAPNRNYTFKNSPLSMKITLAKMLAIIHTARRRHIC